MVPGLALPGASCTTVSIRFVVQRLDSKYRCASLLMNGRRCKRVRSAHGASAVAYRGNASTIKSPDLLRAIQTKGIRRRWGDAATLNQRRAGRHRSACTDAGYTRDGNRRSIVALDYRCSALWSHLKWRDQGVRRGSIITYAKGVSGHERPKGGELVGAQQPWYAVPETLLPVVGTELPFDASSRRPGGGRAVFIWSTQPGPGAWRPPTDGLTSRKSGRDLSPRQPTASSWCWFLSSAEPTRPFNPAS